MSQFKIVIVGSGGVGKSCLCQRFVSGKFSEKYNPTIEDSHRRPYDVDGTAVLLDILDTAGQQEFSSIREAYYDSGSGFILVYSIDSLESFHKVSELHQQIKEAQNKDVPMIICGNKCDLEDEHRVITFAEGQTLAEELGCLFLETSAKEMVNIEETFHDLCVKVLEAEKANPEESENEQKGFFARICALL
ncbi:hypothetical protein PCE1_001908 [Barthelona sp. PCE]